MGNLGNIVFRGYAKKEDDLWVAICIDLNIAAEGDTSEEAVHTCIELITEYLEFVCKEYPDKLNKYIPRPAPQEFIDEYYQLMSRQIAKPVKKSKRKELWDYSTPPSELVPCGA